MKTIAYKGPAHVRTFDIEGEDKALTFNKNEPIELKNDIVDTIMKNPKIYGKFEVLDTEEEVKEAKEAAKRKPATKVSDTGAINSEGNVDTAGASTTTSGSTGTAA